MRLFRKFVQTLTPEQKTRRKKELLLGLLSGILLGISFPPIPLPFLIFFAFIPYLIVIETRENLGSINRFTYFTTFFFTIITLYWVGSWTKEADPFLMISGILLMFVNPALFMIPSTLYFLCRKHLNKNIALSLFPFFWVTFEYLYSLTDLRFPWLTLANSLPYFNLFVQIADVIGAYGISLLILYINLYLYIYIKSFIEERKSKFIYLIVAIILFITPIIYGAYVVFSYETTEAKIKVGLVQPNFNPWEKWEAGNLTEQLDLYFQMSQLAIDRKAELVVWPESALPVYLLSGNYEFEVERIRQFVDYKRVFIMTGMPDANFYFNLADAPSDAKLTSSGTVAYTSYNSILLFQPETNQVQKYGKIKLVPFGEKVPFVEELPFLGDFIKWQVGISSWNVGKEQSVFRLNDSIKVGGVICIESIYPDFVAGFVKKGANILVVVTNDSWYGYSSGPFQHKEISRLRAIENRRAIVRAANGGISCIIDPLGNIVSETKLFTKDILVGEAEVKSDLTFYTKYPLLFPIMASLISIVILIISTIKWIYRKLL